MDSDKVKTIKMECLWCKKVHDVPEDSMEAAGVFNVFCKDDDCEDLYALSM